MSGLRAPKRKRRIAEIKAKAEARRKAIKMAAYGFLGLLVAVAGFIVLFLGIRAYAEEVAWWTNNLSGVRGKTTIPCMKRTG